jgi:hypothetical protein
VVGRQPVWAGPWQLLPSALVAMEGGFPLLGGREVSQEEYRTLENLQMLMSHYLAFHF